MNTLTPCPFCGHSDIKQFTKRMDAEHTIKYLYCENPKCGAVVSFRGVSMPKAVEQWNKRVSGVLVA